MKSDLESLTKLVEKANDAIGKLGSGGGGSGGGSRTSTEKQAVNELIKYYVELERIQQRLYKVDPSSAQAGTLKQQAADIEGLISASDRYTEVIRKRAQESAAVQAAERQTALAMAQLQDEIANAAERSAEKTKEAAEKRAEAYRQEQAAQQALAQNQAAQEALRAAEERAAKIQKVTDMLVRQMEIETELASGKHGKNRTAELQKEYDELTQRLSRYTQATIDAAKKEDEYKEASKRNADKRADILDKQAEAEEKRAEAAAKAAEKEEAAYEKKAAAAEEAARKRANAMREGEIRETFAEEEQKVDELIALYVKLENVKQQIAKSPAGSQERAELEAQAAAIRQKINNSQQYTNAQRQAAQASEKVQAAVDKTAVAQAKANDEAGKFSRGVEGLTNRLVSMVSTMVIMKTMREAWQGMTKYAEDYSNQLNEIQVVTMKSDADMEKMSSNFRSMAKELSVSSKDIASAATTFYRQGLGDKEVEDRLKYTTQYAKIAAMDFEEAADLITATSNSMKDQLQGDIQRVTDVFIYMGDHAGTSAQEIGTAMQKAAASAGQFGMSFEWLASFIATVSETTRQDANVIGTAFNSIIARMHQIRTTGYNQEDETKINDVAKALSTIDVALLDNEGNWRDMIAIYQDVADHWDELDGKQKSYIATAMAGTKQQNTFLALMADLSKGLEGGSRAWELYQGAMNSTGTTLEKYAIWEQSVEAANGRLQASLENVYSIFFDGKLLAGIKNIEAGFLDLFGAATEATGGLNIILPVIGAVIVAFATGTLSVQTFSAALHSLKAHPIILAISAIIAAVLALSAVIGAAVTEGQRVYGEAVTALEGSQQRLNKLTDLKTQLGEMDKEISSGSKSLSDYNGLLEALSGISPAAAQAVASMKDGAMTASEGITFLNGELEKLIAKEQEISKINFATAMEKYQVPKELRSGEWDSYIETMEYFMSMGYNNNLSKNARNQIIYNDIISPEGRQLEMMGVLDKYQTLYRTSFGQELQDLIESFNDQVDLAIESEAGNELMDRLWGIFLSGFDSEQSGIEQEFRTQATRMLDIISNTMEEGMTKDQQSFAMEYLHDQLAGKDG